MKFIASLAALTILCFAHASAQPRVFEERPLARAVAVAEALTASGNWTGALAELEPALDSSNAGEPLDDALYLQSRANFVIRRYSPARTASRRFQAQYPHDVRCYEVRYIDGVSTYHLGDTSAAQAIFSTMSVAGGDVDPWYWRARIFAERRRLDSAEKYAHLALAPREGSSSPYRLHTLYLLGWANEGMHRLDTASAYYRRVADAPENDLTLDARLRLGVIDARRGNHEAALRLLSSLTPRSDRQREEQTFYLGEVSAALGHYVEALQYNTEFVREFPASRRRAQVRYAIGWAQLQLGRYDEAEATFRGLQDGVDSIAAAASYQVAAIAIKRGDSDGAIRTLEAMLARLPYESFSDNAYYQLGRQFYRLRQYDSARHYLLVAARQFPESDVRADAYHLLGEAYAALGDATNAQHAFARAQRAGASPIVAERALYREGAMLYRVGRFRSAIDRFRAYVAQYPSGADAIDATFWLGEALYQDRTYDEAERYYNAYLEKTAATAQWREQALYGLAWSRLQQKDFKGAALAFGDFVKNNGESPLAVEAVIRQADCYRLMGDFDKAIATYKTIGGAAGKGARAEEARFHLADVYLQMGRIDRAVETFRSLVHDFPDSPLRDAYAFNIGSIYREKEMDSLAITELMPFAQTFPQSQLLPQATFTIADAYYNMEQYDSALVYYRRVLDEYPNSLIVPEALDAVRFTLDALGRGDEAVAIIDSFQARNPNRIPADSLNFRKAQIVLESGAFADAIARFTKLLEEFPQSTLAPDAMLGIGRGYEYLNRRDSAVIVYGRIVERYPESAAAENAMIESAGLRAHDTAWRVAAAEYQRFITAYPGSERIREARYGLAELQLRLGDTNAAVMQLKAVLDTGTGNREGEGDLFVDKSRIAYAQVLGARAQTDRALELLAAVVARRMDDLAAEALLLRGRLMLEARDYSAALAELRRLTVDFASFHEYAEPGMLAIGTVYEQLTNYAAARDVYTQLAAQTGDQAIRAEADARLKKLKK